MTKIGVSPFTAEMERLERIANDLALPGRTAAVRAELYYAIARRLRRMDARAAAKLLSYRQRQFVDRDASS
jgi:hypothetical protein